MVPFLWRILTNSGDKNKVWEGRGDSEWRRVKRSTLRWRWPVVKNYVAEYAARWKSSSEYMDFDLYSSAFAFLIIPAIIFPDSSFSVFFSIKSVLPQNTKLDLYGSLARFATPITLYEGSHLFKITLDPLNFLIWLIFSRILHFPSISLLNHRVSFPFFLYTCFLFSFQAFFFFLLW